MLSVFNSIYNFAVGNKIKTILYIIGGIAAISSFVFIYDYIFLKPIRDVQESYEIKITKQNNELLVKDTLLNKAGVVISDLGQDIYDLNNSIAPMLVKVDTKLSECESELRNAKRRANEKIDLSDDTFYLRIK